MLGWILLLSALAACSNREGTSTPGPDSKAPQRLACQFQAGALAVDTVGPERARGDQIPIENVVVLMQENRSYDHYFGQLHDLGQEAAEAVPASAESPDPTGGPAIAPFRQQRYCEVADLSHSWTGTHQSANGGRMDGFAAANVDPSDPTGSRTMGYYTDADLPYYYSLANTFAIADRYFASLMGPTDPNRFYFAAATSFGHISNDLPGGPNEFSQRTLFNLLDEAGVSWKIYQSQFTFALLFGYVRNQHRSNVVPIGEFDRDAAAGTLPQVSIIDLEGDAAPNLELDEHPPHIDPPLHRNAFRPSGADRARCQCGSYARPVRLRRPAVPGAARACGRRDRQGALGTMRSVVPHRSNVGRRARRLDPCPRGESGTSVATRARASRHWQPRAPSADQLPYGRSRLCGISA